MSAERKKADGGRKGEMLICMREGKEVPAEKPLCPHPTSRCEYRELCEIARRLRDLRRRG